MEEIALHHKDQASVAGYNPLDEPTEEDENQIVGVLHRVVKTIRDNDMDHLSISSLREIANTQSSSM